jgi:hypothetical protein
MTDLCELSASQQPWDVSRRCKSADLLLGVASHLSAPEKPHTIPLPNVSTKKTELHLHKNYTPPNPESPDAPFSA